MKSEDMHPVLYSYLWSKKQSEWLLRKTVTWSKLKNGWFRAELDNGQKINDRGVAGQWMESPELALNEVMQDLILRIFLKVNRQDIVPDEYRIKMISLGKLIESDMLIRRENFC